MKEFEEILDRETRKLKDYDNVYRMTKLYWNDFLEKSSTQ